MPISKKDYPPDWDTISLAVRAEAGNCCQWCGVPNHTWIIRDSKIGSVRIRSINNRLYHLPFGDFQVMPDRTPGAVKIVLTVAHLDRDRTNNDLSNLAALCQRCHLNHDRAAQHVPHRKYGRYHDREHQGKLEL